MAAFTFAFVLVGLPPVRTGRLTISLRALGADQQRQRSHGSSNSCHPCPRLAT
jgi:hypothetical protein